ncbi:MAG: hypothetical protein ABIY37_06905 [Devosia sp.]
MKATAAISIAALVAALLGTPAMALNLAFDNLDERVDLGARLGSNGIDAASVTGIDVSADGSADVCEG